ncbi:MULTISPECIES: TetR/AcrR family transcriptional regulator [Nocardiaceae]|nr:TetR/AcrR family transcriptional regulator [Rhodococcus sp. 06-221-2]
MWRVGHHWQHLPGVCQIVTESGGTRAVSDYRVRMQRDLDPSLPSSSRSTSRVTSLQVSVVACRLFLARGVDSTTVLEISRAAGVSARTFHRFFPAKYDSVEPVLRAGMQRYISAVESIDPAITSSEALVDALAASLVASTADFTDMPTRALLELVLTTPELWSVWLRVNEECARALEPSMSMRSMFGGDEFAVRFWCSTIVTADRIASEYWALEGGDIRDHVERSMALLKREWFAT